MHKNRRLVLAVCLMPLLHAQLSEKPETWTRLEGQYSGDTNTDSVLLFVDEWQAVIAGVKAGAKAHNETEDVRSLAYQALGGNNWNAAGRLFGRLLAVYRGMTPGEWLEVASSLQFNLDRRIVAPGVTLHAALNARFSLGRKLTGVYKARVVLLDAQGKVVAGRPAEPVENLDGMEFSLRTQGLPEGEYTARYQLLGGDGKVLAWARRDVLLSATVGSRVRALNEQVRKLAGSGIAMKSPAQALAVQTGQYIAELYGQALDGPGSSLLDHAVPLAFVLVDLQAPRYQPDSIRPERDLALAEWLSKELMAGRNPLGAGKGDLRLAYRSPVDQSLQPFRLFLPPGYDAAKKWPLLVVLHDAGGDEGSYFRQSGAAPGGSRLLELAAERGYVVAAPLGRGPLGYYSNASRQDVLDVLERVSESFSIDRKQVFLAGCGMGAGGVLSVPLGEPDRFAGLFAVAGRPLEALDFSKAPPVPLELMASTGDERVNVDDLRRLAFVLQRRYPQFDYVETTGEKHDAMSITSVAAAFDFFDAVRAGKWKPSGKPLPLPHYKDN